MSVAIAVAASGMALGCTLLPGESRTEASATTAPAHTAAPATTTEPPLLTPYTVVRGDTLIQIADRYGIHLNDLVRVNNIADPTKIFVGQILMIPPPPDPDAGPALTIAPATDPVLPPLLPTTTAPPITLGSSGNGRNLPLAAPLPSALVRSAHGPLGPQGSG